MMRFNLQLFAQKLNTGTSIVDYLKSQGQDSSMSARKELAKSLGITNYSGSYDQNVQMLKALQNSSASNSVSGSKGGGSKSSGSKNASSKATTGSNAVGTSVKGVDKAITDKMTSTYTPSAEVTSANDQANQYLGKVQELANVTDIIDPNTWNAINTPFSASPAYTEAMNYTNSLLQQLSSGRTSYTDQINALMSDIQGRDKFSYDADTDTLFQQALASAMGSGKTAMQDTIGQASALTGGYASTYATSAGNQAYNAYIQDAYANLPEYYQMALEAYQMEGNEMYQQLAMLSDADASEYERMYNSWNANFSNAQQMYQNEYGAWQDSVNNAYNSANLQLNEHSQMYDAVYGAYTATANNAQQMYQNEYAKWADEVANAQAMANMMNSDYWNTEELTQRQNEFNEEMGYKRDALEQDNTHFYASLGEEQRQFNESSALEQSQFIARYDLNGDGVVDSKDQEVEASTSGSGSKEPSETQMSKALESYNTGGMNALNQYINALPSTVDKDKVAEYVGEFGTYDTADNPLALTDRTWEMLNDGGWNGGWGIDRNAIITDQYDNNISLGDLYDQLQEEGMSKTEAEDWIINLQKQLGI